MYMTICSSRSSKILESVAKRAVSIAIVLKKSSGEGLVKIIDGHWYLFLTSFTLFLFCKTCVNDRQKSIWRAAWSL
jgi:hypothetical protein